MPSNQRVLEQTNDIFNRFLINKDRPEELRTNKVRIIKQALANCCLLEKNALTEAELGLFSQELNLVIHLNSSLPSFIENGDAMELIPTGATTAEKHEILAKNLFRHLLRGTPICEVDGQPHTQSLLSDTEGLISNTLLSKRNPELVSAFRKQVQDILIRSFTSLKSGILTPSDEKQYEIFQTNFLAMYPFMDPQNGSTINVPQKINEQWLLVTYTVQRLDISPQSGPLSWVIEDEDRMYAYVLNPDKQQFKTAYAHLLLMGTTYPAGQGAGIANAYNFFPRHAAGEAHEMSKVEEWLLAQDDKTVKVTGHSKGAIQAQIMAGKFPYKIIEANCLNPSGLPRTTQAKILPGYNAVADADKPSINVYTQDGDPVFPFEAGFLPGTRIIKVFPTRDVPIMNCCFGLRVPLLDWRLSIPIPERLRKSYQAHINLYSGWSHVLMVNGSLSIENASQRRIFLGEVKSVLNLFLFPIEYLALFLAIVMRQAQKWAQQNATQTFNLLSQGFGQSHIPVRHESETPLLAESETGMWAV